MGNTANYDSTLRKKQLAKCAKSPTCLDELYEWTVWATDMIHNLENVDFGTVRAFVRRSSIMGHCKDLDLIHQQNIDFSREKAVDLSDFFEANVMLLVEIGFSAESEKELNCSISVSEFCNYYVLLRRYFEFMEIRTTIPKKCSSPSKCSECIICMSRHEDVVLPCLHSMCSHCASKWIDVSGDCPFCRKRYNSRKKFETNQWKVCSSRAIIFYNFFLIAYSF
mmetsp:Transcript_21747/g.32117  ORF Transcript_21747/g.32117 Transcript_21747/m.32117 type:complete len:223 (+) Transcript_21747:123-791(+)